MRAVVNGGDTSWSATDSRNTTHASNLKLIYMNARSVKSVSKTQNKPLQFKNILATTDPDIVVVTETWLNENVDDAEFMLPSFVVHRKDRLDTVPDKRGGGVLVGINRELESTRRADLEVDDEIVVCELKPPSHPKIALIACYRPPSGIVEPFTYNVKLVLENVYREFKYVCLVGDFNMPRTDWSHVNSSWVATKLNFVDVMSMFSLVQLNTIPSTEHGNILDLVITNAPELIGDISELPVDFSTNHAILTCEFNIKRSTKEKVRRTVYNFKAADFDVIRSELSELCLADTVSSYNDVEDAWSYWSQSVMHVVESHVPKVTVPDSTLPPWVTSEARHLQNLKHTAWKKAKRTNKPQHWAKFRKLRNKLKNLLTQNHAQFLTDLGRDCTGNPKRFWSYFRMKSKSKTLPETVKNADSTGATLPEDKAKLFNDYFYSVFSADDPHGPLPAIKKQVDSSLSDIQFSVDTVQKAMADLDAKKACGPESLPVCVLKECRQQLAPSLARLFNLSMETGHLPSQWKHAHVIPIHKSGDKELIINYRPISLLDSVSKLMERCIHSYVYPIIKPHIHELQHGFVQNRSSTMQMLKVYDQIGATLDKGGQTDVIFLDFCKAFASVSHKLLVHKLQTYGFNGKLLNWINTYLSGRQQRVMIEGKFSDWLPVSSGVVLPQGSILGPLLFLLFINDMPLVASGSHIALYADDAKCFKEVRCLFDALALQTGLDNLNQWSKTWGMKFNVKKCKTLSITRCRNPVVFTYHLDGSPLEHVDNYKDLGMVVDKTLSWSQHVQTVISKSSRVAGMIKRSVGFSAPSSVTLQLYKSLVRSNLEYSTPVWSPHYAGDVKALERVQRGMTKYILGYPDASYEIRCQELNILPLSFRREVMDLVFLFKSIHAIHDFSVHDHIEIIPSNTGRRSANSGLLLRGKHVRTETFMASYFNRIVNIWNSLPQNLRDSACLGYFKSGVIDFYTSKLQEYDCNISNTWNWVCGRR